MKVTLEYINYTNTDVEIQSLGFGLGLSKKYTEILKWVLITTMLNLNLTKQGSKFLKLVLIPKTQG
jgi:hypothetical protein